MLNRGSPNAGWYAARMSSNPLDRPPPLPSFGIPVLLRALFKRPTSCPPGFIDAGYRLARVDLDHVRRYRKAFGFTGDTIPLTFLYLLAQRAQLAAMLDRPIPFRIPGLIHVENRLAMHGPVSADAPLALTTSLQLPPAAPNGALSCVLQTRAYDGDRLAFSCDSTYLIRRGSRASRGDAPQPESPSGTVLGQWKMTRDAGRRYAALSGDWNPIHLWPWSARLMGMKKPIIHGAHTLAHACALLEAESGSAIESVWCRFRQPIALGADAILLRGEQQGSFVVICDGRLALEGQAS